MKINDREAISWMLCYYFVPHSAFIISISWITLLKCANKLRNKPGEGAFNFMKFFLYKINRKCLLGSFYALYTCGVF